MTEVSYPRSVAALLEAKLHCAIAAQSNGLRLIDAIARPDIQKRLLEQGLEPINDQVRLCQLEVGDLRVVWVALQTPIATVRQKEQKLAEKVGAIAAGVIND